MRRRLYLFLAIVLLSVPITAHADYNSGVNFFESDDEHGAYNPDAPLEEALDVEIKLLKQAFKKAQIRIANEYIWQANGIQNQNPLFEIFYNVTSTVIQFVTPDEDAEYMGDYNVLLTQKSIYTAMEECGSMDYKFILAAISLLDEYRLGNVTYKSFTDYVNSDSILQYLCKYEYEDAYGRLKEDGTIEDCSSEDEGACLYIKTSMRPCTVKDVFEMLGLDPDAASEEIPCYTNYELALLRVSSMQKMAPYYDFGQSSITYTYFDTYKYAMSKDLVYLQSGMLIPLYHQQDYPNSPYSQHTTVSKSGCGPTSMAMITSYMTGKAVYPDEIASAYGKYYVKGKGSSHQLFYAVAKDYGYKCKSLDVNAQVIINELNKGHPVIVTVGKGDFTSQAHVMVIRGVTEDGCFLLNDSNANNYKKYETDKFEVQMVMQNIGTKGHAYSFSF